MKIAGFWMTACARSVARSLGWSRRAVGLLVFLYLPFLAGSPAVAQSECEAALQAAENSYKLGFFEDVPGQLAPCLKGRASRTEIVRAQALLAKSYLASDQPEKARDAVTEILRVDPSYEPISPPQFVRLVEEIRPRAAELQVATVSKTNESLQEAPATVVVIRAEEIEERGYLDLEEVLHDLPGFDISRGNGETYSNVYQRGFRSNDNNRILLLVDGVEQNDIATSVAHLSRQYPVSAVDRIEVVYGPASTIYGAKAHSGVINIIMKQPEAFIPKGRRFGTLVQAANGSFTTRYTDLALAGRDRSGSVAWSVTGRLYRSDEMDLSKFPGWDFDLSSTSYKDVLRLAGSDAEVFCFLHDCAAGSDPFFEVRRDAAGNVQTVELTDAGERRARELDEAIGSAVRFSDKTEDWSLYAKLRLASLTIGLQAWNLEEGTAPWYTQTHAPSSWAPEHRSFFVKYARTLGRSLSLSLFTHYRQTNLDPQRSARNRRFTYADGPLTLFSLVDGCLLTSFPPSFESPCRSKLEDSGTPRQLADQAAAEITLVYSPRRQFTLVSGVELKKGSIQTKLAASSEIASIDQLVDHTDVGLYAQASYKPLPTLSLVAGGRLDYNEASSPEFPDAGFGTLFSPRLAIVYLPAQYVLKLIYSEAFKDPSDFEKLSQEFFFFDDLLGRLPNPKLRPERTRSLEISAGWHPNESTSVELSAYRARFDDIVGLGFMCLPEDGSSFVPQPCPANPRQAGLFVFSQFQNLEEIEVQGMELRADGRLGRISLDGNFTYTNPRGTRPPTAPGQVGSRSQVRIGDIASQRANLGFGFPLWKKASLNLRWSYVGSRRTGAETTVPTNPLSRIDAYSVANATFTYKDVVVPGASLQLIVKNLLDEAYEHPGVASADGDDFAASIPQPGRTVYLRLTWGLQSRKPEGAGNILRP